MEGSKGKTTEGMTLTIIGAGKMGTAVLAGILRNHQPSAPISRFIACIQSDASYQRLRSKFPTHGNRLQVLQKDNLAGFQRGDIILLACKPYMAKAILKAPGVREALDGKLLISVLAGTPPAKLQEAIEAAEKPLGRPMYYVTRATPNMAAALSESMTIIEESEMPPPFARATEWMFRQVGEVRYVAPDLFDVGSALVGAGIAFLTVAVDGLLDGAVAEGIKRPEANAMLAQTMLGLVRLLQKGEHPAVLREEIASPRGTTIRGLLALEAGGVRSCFSSAVIDATVRAKEL